MSFASGKAGRLFANGTYWKIQKWSVSLPTALLDTTNGDSGGRGEYIANIGDLNFDIEACHDVGTNPFATFEAGGVLSAMQLYAVSDGGGGFNWPWQIDDAIIEEVEPELDVRGLVTMRIRGRASYDGVSAWNGSWTPIENEAV